MKTAGTLLAFVAAVRAQSTPLQTPAALPVPNEFRSQGCFSSQGDWQNVTLSAMSMGSCTEKCKEEGFWVSGLNGNDCYCGQNYPPEDDLVEDDKCSYPCPQYPKEACGGIRGGKYYSVFNNGIEVGAEFKEDTPASSTSATDAAAKPTTTGSNSQQQETAQASPTTASPQESSDNSGDKDDGGPSMGGIIGGVVAGVVVLAIGAGIGFWIWRRRRNFDIEEEHRRNAAVNSFISGGKPPGSSGGLSMTDSRMEPTLGNRRMSDGSIADNHDYSRKILRVTNA